VTGMSVEPYRELTFDKDGEGPPGQAAELSPWPAGA
jgi:hypothetical protein